jgi:S1-C subfamily serine protease
MGKKMTKGLVWSLSSLALLFGLFFCMDSDRVNSLPKNDKITTVKSLGQAFVEVAKKVQPAVVNITTEKTITMRPWDRYGEDFFKGSPFEDFFRGFGFSPREKGKEYRQKQRSGGSGVIVDKRAMC